MCTIRQILGLYASIAVCIYLKQILVTNSYGMIVIHSLGPITGLDIVSQNDYLRGFIGLLSSSTLQSSVSKELV